MNHAEMCQRVQTYCPDMLHLVVDRWNRWPDETTGHTVIDALRCKGSYWERIGFDKEAVECEEAACAIELQKSEIV